MDKELVQFYDIKMMNELDGNNHMRVASEDVITSTRSNEDAIVFFGDVPEP